MVPGEWATFASHLQGGASGQTPGLVDFDLNLTTSAFCPILLEQLQIWQNWHSTWTTYQNFENQSQQNLGSDLMHHPLEWRTSLHRTHTSLPSPLATPRPLVSRRLRCNPHTNSTKARLGVFSQLKGFERHFHQHLLILA